MRISVVTAVYNRANTIVQAMESVRGQTYPDVEHIIQDGGSSDGTLERIVSMGSGFSLVSEHDNGIYDAINRGIARASGDVIGLMHSDDYFADDHILERVTALFADSTVDGVYGDLQYVSGADTDKIVRHWHSGYYMPKMLARGWMPPHPTLYLRREIFERLGTYDTTFSIAADYDAMLRYLAKGRIKLAYLPEVMVKMRLGGESNRSVGRIIRKSLEDYRAIKRNGVGGFGTLAAKNLSKISQFFVKEFT
ncbi:glycosyltransferase family 2 protein [Parafrankia sp. BMG5.11]|uniref:glycosyltransferase family 2 protein n=1 Tax=Parafrankia sp. BMG5.11 TaxID=222540 RepID=UPI00103F731C|nr:glycosyltransferase family 2 protein [Parafrankia sp. BMG5.11]TCJ39576.1 glycosyltransferase [Parafrankia sp. BMG5.11]